MKSRDEIEVTYDRLAQRAAEASDPEGAIRAFSPGERALFVTLYVDAEIVNGGFSALVYNPTGRFWHDAIDAATLIGAERHAELLGEGAALFPGGRVPVELAERNRLLDSFDENAVRRLEDLDEEWYALEDELLARLGAYVEAHAAEF